MKSKSELQTKKTICEKKLEELYRQKERISFQIEETEQEIREIKSILSNYEKCQQEEEEHNYRKTILNWLSGQSETFLNIGWYEGVVCPSLGIFEFKNNKPKGTQEEIISLLNEKKIKMITFSTKFVPCGMWGDDVVSINFYNKL